MSAKAISLMAGMLGMDPKKRLTALESLGHPYFDSIRTEDVQELIAKSLESKERISKQQEPIHKPKNNASRSKDMSRRNTSTDKHLVKSKKNPYSVAIGASPPQMVKKKYTNWLYKDRKSSNSIKNLLQGRSSSKDVAGKRNIGMGSYNNTAYSIPKNHRNMPGSDVLRENQSMSTYIPASFNGLYLQNAKNQPEGGAEYDYEIGGEFGNKMLKQANKLDNSMGLPSQVYGTDDLKNSVSSSISNILNKGIFQLYLIIIFRAPKDPIPLTIK
jgi:serine/threonine protein kinase